MLALKMLIYVLVNSAFSSFACLKLALAIQLFEAEGQYALVQPIASNFAERCIYAILTTKWPYRPQNPIVRFCYNCLSFG